MNVHEIIEFIAFQATRRKYEREFSFPQNLEHWTGLYSGFFKIRYNGSVLPSGAGVLFCGGSHWLAVSRDWGCLTDLITVRSVSTRCLLELVSHWVDLESVKSSDKLRSWPFWSVFWVNHKQHVLELTFGSVVRFNLPGIQCRSRRHLCGDVCLISGYKFPGILGNIIWPWLEFNGWVFGNYELFYLRQAYLTDQLGAFDDFRNKLWRAIS